MPPTLLPQLPGLLSKQDNEDISHYWITANIEPAWWTFMALESLLEAFSRKPTPMLIHMDSLAICILNILYVPYQ